MHSKKICVSVQTARVFLKKASKAMATTLAHYSMGGRLMSSILQGVEAMGLTTTSISWSQLDMVDEFHIGGRDSCKTVLESLDLKANDVVLDVGAGIGGPARVAASEFGCRVVGIDLSDEYVQAGNAISTWPGVNLADKVSLKTGNATDMQELVTDDSVDKAYLLHVGMNIHDKSRLAKELHRVVKPGGRVAIFDMMLASPKGTHTNLPLPLPFATSPEECALSTADEYKKAFLDEGFTVHSVGDKGAYCKDTLNRMAEGMKAYVETHGSPPPLGLHLLMGTNFRDKMANVRRLFEEGTLTAQHHVYQKKKPETCVPK